MLKLSLVAALAVSTAAVAQTPASPTMPGMSFEQWAAHAREHLMALDTNHDGKISRDEFAARAAMMAEHRHHEDAGMTDASTPPKHDGARAFDRFDLNHDGVLDTSEVNAMLARRFARMDANHDGMLTPDERHAMHRGGGAAEQ